MHIQDPFVFCHEVKHLIFKMFEFFSALDTFLCCPYFAAVVVAAAETRAEYKPNGSSVHV